MPENEVIKFLPAGDLPGTFRKRLIVPEERIALLVESEEVVGQREPGEHFLGNWPKPAPDAVQLPQIPFDIRPRIQHLKSGDGQLFDLVWSLTVQFENPAHFYSVWLAQAPENEAALLDMEDYLAGQVWEAAQKQVAQYTLLDLQHEEQVQASLGRAMRGQLVALLHNLGLGLVGSQRPQPQTLEDDRAVLESMNQLARAARDARFEAVFERLEDEEMLAQRLLEWSAERGEGPPDPALVDLLWQVVEQGPEESALRAQQATQALQREVASLRLTVQSERTQNERHFRQLLARLEKAEGVAPEASEEVDPARLLRRLLFVLRILGTGLTLLAALTALLAPQLVQEYIQLRGAALIFSVAIGVLTLISDLFLRRKVRQAREKEEEQRRAESRASLKRRREAARLVQARVESGLKQVVDSLEAAWKKGYSSGGAARDLAVELREASQNMSQFGQQDVRMANYQASRYLVQERVPDAQLAAMLDLDEDLLARSQGLAQTAQTLYEQVNAGQVDHARTALKDLENGMNALRNRFTERGAYLMNPA